jgi:hypothetical protein
VPTVTEIENWLTRYEQTRQDMRNPVAYWVAMPMFVIGITGLLWALPIPSEFEEISPLLNWGSTFLMVTAIYYFIISLSIAIGLLPLLLGLAAIQMWLLNSGFPVVGIAIGLLVAGACGLILSRGGSLLGVLQDLQLVMIGPAWVLSVVYRRFGIPV